jgi:hypothetical protein
VELVFKGLMEHTNPEDAFHRVAQNSERSIHLLPRFGLYRERFAELHGTRLIDAIASDRAVGEVIKTAGATTGVVIQLDLLLRTGMAECRELEAAAGDVGALERTIPGRVPL